MRTLLVVVISLALLPVLIATRADTAASAPRLKFINITHDAALERNPSLAWSSNGDVTVAWEQDVYSNGPLQQDIFARIQHNGTFGPAFNISNDPAPSHEPSVFGLGPLASVLYQEPSQNSSSILRSDWSGTAWSTPQIVGGGNYALSLNPIGVQASDGKVWLVRWARTVGNHSDIIVQQIGGPTFNVSNDGRAWRHPALVAGNSGEVYVAWIDHTSIPRGAFPGVRVAKVTAGGVVAMQQPTTEYYAYWPGLAYQGGQLYVVWVDTLQRLVRERVWNGTAWGAELTLATGDTPRVAATGGNVYVAWANQGRIYLQENSGVPQVVSGLTKAQQPALAVDGSGNAEVAFIAYGDVWYVQVPSQ